ncbi:beta-glucosidase [Verticillium alfalfae VaMs.102]|uniref:Probable beta-glucosidase F n=1 Tax=Verticillium alfalfae (strain VaMs.102 / ATCC MYA-4576 / FGSC 10136) TaxID=526221 RepID=C9SFD5_VERA1|nr:beta-glucosidase [Verticillium alfalfae VaMs.102]EEY17921.1 beta-glucosidase [Verticillium alfalfae VaMs.102]
MAPSPLNLLLLGAVLSHSTASVISPRQRVPDGRWWMGATWDKDLIYRRAVALGKEFRGKGVNVWLGPSVGPLGRKPKGGRNWEGFGSDPVLQAKAGALSIKGVQEQGVIATIKHLIGNEQEMSVSIMIIYLWPFAEGIRAGSGAVMTAYNAVNGSASVHNSQMINGVLKNELGFQGFVMSDWFSQMSGVDAAIAGLNMAMPGDTQVPLFGYSYWMYDLTRSVLNGSVPMDRLNDMTTRIVATWLKFGQDEGFPKVNFHLLSNDAVGDLYQAAWPFSPRGVINEFVQVQADHNLVAREVAQDAITLLKNNGSLSSDRDISITRREEDLPESLTKLTGGSTGQPQDTFSEGLYIDYRYLNKNGIKPRFAFGHGLSYTNFNFTDPSISAVTQLSRTPPAPPSRAPVLNFNQAIHPWQQGVVPAGFNKIFRYLYSWCTEGEAKQAVRDREDGKKYPYPPGYTTVQPSAVPASGASGGNPRLFDVAFRVSVTVRNTGATHTGRASVQAYVQFPDGGPETPDCAAARTFEKTSRLAPGGSQVVTLALTRKDLSIWMS